MTRYKVQERLASGGMGTVYSAVDTVTGARLALKRLTLRSRAAEPGVATEIGPRSFRPISDEAYRTAIESFEREYQVLASLQHPRIIRVFDYGVDGIGPYYTMELIDGDDLRRGAPVPYREACLYLRDVATCLALLHARRFIHRDISPSNVRRTSDGHCKVLDFGALMSFGRPSAVVGTPPALAPEALSSVPLDARADLYSLGALAYWLLTGQHAYPARALTDLFDCWQQPPLPPSALKPGIPTELDELVLSLLSLDPLGRPGTAGEIIARLNVIGALPEEDRGEALRLAGSFILNPAFTGRQLQLANVQTAIDSLAVGSGGALNIQAAPGMGRTRFLDEVAVRVQLVGATVLVADGRTHSAAAGIKHALVSRLVAAMPDVASSAPRAALSSAESGEHDTAPPIQSVEDWFAELSRDKPIALLVDNVDYADDASLAFLAAAAKLARDNPLLVVTAGKQPDGALSSGLLALRAHSTALDLPPLRPEEMRELMRSVFGDAPNVKRFADWIQERSGGGPLHATEIVRQLVAKQIIHYTGGIWTVPVDRPDVAVPEALEDILAIRIAALSDASRTLAECLSLTHERPSFELCRSISRLSSDGAVSKLLDELARCDVLRADGSEYRFTSMALCDVLRARIDSRRLERNHERLGEVFAEIAGDQRPALSIQAGWHLIQGRKELRGAAMIARVASDPVTVRTLLANLHRAGHALEAALEVYGKHGRTIYERLPLLASLAQAGYYEDRGYANRYADAALDALELVSGLRGARLLRRFLGRWLGLICGILLAALRFRCVPRQERLYSFKQVLTHLFGTVTALSAGAAVTLDSQRATRFAEVLEPFSVLPSRLTPVGIYDYCKGLALVPRDQGPTTYQAFDEMLRRFQDKRYYPSLPDDARKVYVAAAHYARGSFAVFRANGEAALESASALDQSGLALYAAVASQLHFLYYMNRGELAKAMEHREEFELRAAHLGSLWQVEIWEGPALLLVHTLLSDIVPLTRLAHRIDLLSRDLPSLKIYAHRANECLLRSRKDPKLIEAILVELRRDEPRSYIGWAAATAFWAAGYNAFGHHQDAKRVCEYALEHLTDEDRDYVSLSLNVELQLAIADAGLGQTDQALGRVDALLARFASCNHPLACGLLHETRARVAFVAGLFDEYTRSLAEVERWFISTGAPILIARFQRLAELKQQVPGTSENTSVQLRAAASAPAQCDVQTEALFRTRTLCMPDLLGIPT